MILSTHAVVGAAAASFMPTHPVLAFTAGFVSHFLLDCIPHWEYKLASIEKNESNHLDVDMKIGKSFFFDLMRIGLDVLLGFAAGLYLFRDSSAYPIVIMLGMIGSIVPDFLQFVYFKVRRQPLTSLQKFHIYLNKNIFVKASTYLYDKPVLGASCQVIVVILVYSIVRLIGI